MIAYEGNIRVPAKLPLEIVVTDNGHVTLDDRNAFTKVRTRRGDLRFQACKGGIVANTGQGNVIAFDHEGDLDVRTGLGDMQVFIVKPGKQVTLSTGQGTVQCHVPKDIEFEVEAPVEAKVRGRAETRAEYEAAKQRFARESSSHFVGAQLVAEVTEAAALSLPVANYYGNETITSLVVEPLNSSSKGRASVSNLVCCFLFACHIILYFMEQPLNQIL